MNWKRILGLIIYSIILIDQVKSQNTELNLGHKNYDNQDFKEAIYWYSKYLDKNPTDAYVYCLRGTSYNLLNDSSAAISDYQKALSLDDKNAKIYYHFGQFYQFRKNYKEALQYFDKALNIKILPEFIHSKATTYFLLNDISNAIKLESEYLNLDTTYFEVYANRGYYHYLNKDFNASLRDLNKAIELFNKDHVSYANRAITYISLGNYEKALLDFDNSLQISPNSPDVLVKKGDLLMKMHRSFDACPNYKKALYIDKNIKINPEYKKYCNL